VQRRVKSQFTSFPPAFFYASRLAEAYARFTECGKWGTLSWRGIVPKQKKITGEPRENRMDPMAGL
jgi:hypothetical protein